MPALPALKSMRHIIAIHLQNEAGALTRVTGLFSTRGYNIESLSVAATDDPLVSRVTLVTKGADGVILQIVNQLNKLVDVVAVEDLTRGEHPRGGTQDRVHERRPAAPEPGDEEHPWPVVGPALGRTRCHRRACSRLGGSTDGRPSTRR